MFELIFAIIMASFCHEPKCTHSVWEHQIQMMDGDDDGDTGGETGTPPPPKPPTPPPPPPGGG